MKEVLDPGPLPWSQRFLDRIPLSPLWVGVLLSAVLVLTFVAFELALGRFELIEVETYREDFRVAVGLCVLTAYFPVAWLYSVRSAQRTADDLVPWLSAGRWTEKFGQAGEYNWIHLRIAGCTGIGLLLVSAVLVESGFGSLGDPGSMSPEAYFHRVLLAGIGWFGARAVYATWVESRRFWRVGREGLEIDLLDLAAVRPLSRYGLRQALVTIGAFSVMAPLFYDSSAAPHLIWLLISASIATLGLAIVGLFSPIRGANESIARQKEAELVRINEKIRLARDGAGEGRRKGRHESTLEPGLADWVAYRALIESVREWAIDLPTLRRFALYLAIPLGSWFGGAIVERVLDTLID